MEFANQGAICQYETCRQRDYLPFDCERCSRRFCLAHRTRDQHECPSLKTDAEVDHRPPPPPPVTLPKKYKCHHRGCRTRELQPIACRNCAHNFCIGHRFPQQHACEALRSGGLARNTILKAGIIPPRPLDANNSSDHSTASIATATSAASPVVSPIAAASAAASFTVAATASPSVTCEIPLAALSIASAPSAPLAVLTTPSPPPSLIRQSSQSCAAEVAAVHNGSHDSTAASTTAATPIPTSMAVAVAQQQRRRANTNLAHLSKLLRPRA